MTRDWAVVTGASSGIGKAFAAVFAKNGINLVLTARDGARLASLAIEFERDYGIKTVIYAGDLSTSRGIKGLVDAVQESKIRVKYLVNNAGFGLYGDFVGTPWMVEKSMIELNIAAVTYLTKVFAELMKERGQGHILNVASTAAFFSGPKMAVYYATKAYVLHFSEAVNQELKGSGVTVTAYCPGPTATNFASVAQAGETKLFTRNLPTADAVAGYGFKAMQAGRAVAIYGWRNKLAILLARFIPRSLLVRIIARINR
ncbi:MAG: Short-chain dehydrogenase [Candidatus Saccharibacteria bacterium]|nr:Short-chain dehydrogenase [Candidatus Saccharibacteria bacterium]